MGNSHDYVALDWVRGEIDETLNQARQALEAYVENTEDTSRIRFCLNYIHQVHGTLQMVEFYGAALLAEEMEKLAQALLNQAVPNLREAVEVLMQAVLQLPSYLEHLHAGRKDLPLVILPILNDLRASRGESLLSDTSLFTPDLSAARITAPAGVVQRLQDEKVIASLRKLRQMFQFSLAGAVRGNEVKANTAYMVKVLTRVERLCQHTSIGQLWSVAIAFIEVFDDNEVELTSATKTLLRDLDHQLKRLIDESVDILLQPIPEDLLKHLLYYIAKSDTDTEHVRKVRELFNLDQSLPKDEEVDAERARMQGPDKDAIESVVSALNEELARIKDQLDLFVRGEFRDNADLEELLPGLKQVANTMAVLGLGIPRKVILEQVEVIEALIEERGEAEDSTLMDIAGALLYVEATLTGMTEEHASTLPTQTESDIPAEQLGNAHDALLREARNGLEQAKTCIVNFIASQWDHSEIEGVPAILDGLRGGLQIIPLTKASELINSCNQYIQQALLSKRSVPDWKQLDTLADAITSIEYYIERLTEGAQDNELILQVAEESVTELGFPPGEAPTYTESSTEQESSSEEPLSDFSPDAPSKESDAELIDDEIIEIFIEEAEEVLSTIAEFYPKFLKDHQQKGAIVELRRAFHTLKGSGRLVGAATLGELAWSVENMLNRVLDNTISISKEIFPLLEDVIQKLPQLVSDFKEKQPSEDVSDLIDQANVIAGVPRSGASKEASIEAASSTSETEQHEEIATATAPEADATEATESIEVEDAATSSDAAADSDNTVVEEQAPIAATSRSNDDDDLIDDEIIEIFIEETEEVLETIAEYLPTYLSQHDNREALTELRRAFHTLKGSGRMVSATTVGELSWAAENMMNRIIDGSIVMSNEIGDVLSNVTALLPDLIEDFKLQQAPRHDVTPLIQQAESLSEGQPAAASDSSTAETTAASITSDVETDSGVDPVLLDIFRSETDTHLDTINEFVDKAEAEGELAFTDAISRALHTLKGSANTAGIGPIASIIVPVEKFVKDARALNIPANPAVSDMLRQAAGYVRQGIEQLYNDPQHVLEGTEEFLSHLNELSELTFAEVADVEQVQSVTTDPQLINIFLTEGIDILLDAESILNNWRNNPVPGEELEKLVGELKTLSQGAQVAGLDDISEFADLLEEAYELIESGDVVANDNFLDTIAHGHEALLSLMDQVAAGLATQPNNKLIAEIKELIQSIEANKTAISEAEQQAIAQAAAEAEKLTQQEQEALKELDEELEVEIPTLSGFDVEEEIPTLDSTEESETALPQLSAEDSASLLDPELVEIFLEEANDIINNTGELLQQWSEDTTNPDLLVELQRELHTLKGGARLADISSIGDLSHELETLFEGLTDKRLTADESLVTLLFSCHDRLASTIDDIASGNSGAPATDLISQIQQVISATPESAVDAPIIEEAPEETIETESLSAATELEASVSEETAEAVDESQQAPVDLDPELIEIFLEEANDIVENSGNLIQQWQEDPSQHQVVNELQRELHTLKGGARMAEITAIGDLSHELESLFERIVDGQINTDSDIINLSLSVHDRLATMVEEIEAGQMCRPAPELISQITALISGESTATTDEPDEIIPELTLEDAVDEEQAETSLDESSELTEETAEQFIEAVNEEIDEQLEENVSEEIDFGDIPTLETDEEELESLDEIPSDDELLSTIDEPSVEIEEALTSEADSVEDVEFELEATEPETGAIEPEAADAESLELDSESDETETTDAVSEEATPILAESLDPELVEIFLEEASEIIDNTGELLQSWLEDINDTSNVKELQRELHTLKGGARMAEIGPLGDLAHELETLFEGIVENGLVVDSSISDLMLACHDKLATMVDQIGSGSAIYPANDLIASVIAITNGDEQPVDSAATDIGDSEVQDSEVQDSEVQDSEVQAADDAEDDNVIELTAPITDDEALASESEALSHESEHLAQESEPEELTSETAASEELEDKPVSEQDFADDLNAIFLEEAREICEAITDSLDHWNEAPASLNGVIDLQRELHTLKGGARLADIDNIGNLADALYEKLEAALNASATDNKALIQVTNRSAEQLTLMLNELESSGQTTPAVDLIDAINAIAIDADQSDAVSTDTDSEDANEAADAEILEIFLDEANEILEALDNQTSDWSTDTSNNDFNLEIQRLLHTLKGGARLAGLEELGNVSHELESKLIAAAEQGDGLTSDLLSTVNQYQDKLNSLITEVNHRFIALTAEQATQSDDKPVEKEASAPQQTGDTQAPELQADHEEAKAPEATASVDASGDNAASTEPATTAQQQDRVTTTAKKPDTQAKKAAAARPAQQETVRVSAALIDDLVNLAGETSITRGRLEQQISDFSFNLDEMVSTIERLREQLRRMDMETEAQVLFRTEKEGVGPDYADFDPLEMDRYSSIQQLSRALTESTFDLLDLRETLADKARDAETLLLQQSRIHTELQEGLMKTRMIPFSSMVPRLRRIVRQISGELGKKAEFDVQNAEGEMDRTVLERMVAPLEHMLRNALDHGIESIEKRKAAGKPEAGTISLSLNREGGDIVLRMKDDGGGIKVDVIRDKAIAQGLMKKGAALSDHDILQFIMKAGFSTAEQVTQISGRGVGMDVVASEIKMLGGNISIDSKEGAGTTFTVRLPFTVSVNRALMVNTGDDFYAIPLNTIEGIVRVSPYELEEYYKPDAPLYEYAGQQYRLQYLGNVLHSDHKPKLQGQPLPLPVILVRGTDHPIALQVDSLMGSREIVVKSLGAQFSKVPGVSGATILGDGSVVVILDLPALIRADDGRALTTTVSEVEVAAPVEQRPTLVMVVDDSVTVRKVTTRLLERNGMDVITAKDGVDAIAQLQDHKPDVMLLDIEMPRMDGFEVASLVRHDENLKDVPICMITSRTGQKHRERAMSIGVNEYLGKPFQEKELLNTIEKLTDLS
ncbi:Hpt domain-containing protein [Alkalimarinus sediminis]|uniref:Chemotaxis protein CheA n=1 Tax=Alkalimarinus sediminis TaxID=1632866 RepID=A0A9E8HQB5_9ALTE|nr:Hpt domain-containing protein [Alkalimarinus sediminis]UZW74591.1 Hpt domain-containing protein [Alkalimarinus sediminis]